MFKLKSAGKHSTRVAVVRFCRALLVLSCCGLVFVCPVLAAEQGAVVSLEVLLKGAKENNQQLISAAAEAQRYQTRIPLIDNLSDPLLAFYYLDFPIANISSGWSARENQEKAGPATIVTDRKGRGSILNGRDMVEDQALWYQYLHEDLVLQVSSQVRQNFYQLYFLNKIIAVAEQNLLTLDILIKASDASYAVGKVRQKDVLGAQLERYQLQAELLRLRQQQLATQSRLNYLVGRSPTHGLVPRLAPELSSENLPELRYSVLNLVSGLYQNKPLVKGYQALGGRFKAMRGMVQMYFNREVRDEAMFEADSGFRAIKAKGTDYYNKLGSEIQTTAGNLAKNRELSGLYEKVIVPQGRQTFSVALADFRVGKEDYSVALKALLNLNRDQVLYFQALSDYMVDLARLEELSGVPLDQAPSITAAIQGE